MLLRLRQELPALRTENTRFIETREPVLAFMRDDKLQCLFNLSPYPQRVEVDGLGTLLLNEGVDLQQGAATLQPNATLIADITRLVAIRHLTECAEDIDE